MMRALVVSVLTLLGAARAEGQLLRVVGESDDPAAVRLREIVDRGQFRVLERDTLLPAGVEVSGDLVVIDAAVRVEGSVTGSVAVLPGGEFFLRPGARVSGSALSIGGGLFVSGNASVGERLELPAATGTRLEHAAGSYTLVLTPPRGLPRLQPTGIMGIGFPTYDRVNGLTASVGALARLGADSAAPVVVGTLRYHAARSAFGGGLEIRAPLSRRTYVRADVARRTESPDAWIRDDLINSAAVLLVGSDARNYHESDLVALEIGRLPPAALEAGEYFLAPRLRVAASRARSLLARDIWSLLPPDDGPRANPPIDDGTILSALPGAAFGWQGLTSQFAADLEVEWGSSDVADDFALLTAAGSWNAAALWGHTITLRGRVRHPLGDAPRQRRSLLGGPGTLPTFDTGTMWGDHLVFLASRYDVPVPELVLPFVGSPSIVLRHAVGSAWGDAGDAFPPLEQNLGVGLAFPLVRASADIDPTDPERVVFSVSGTLPF